MSEELRGFSVSWARAIAAGERVFSKRPFTEAQQAELARLFHAARYERGFDWLPDDDETDALVRRARGDVLRSGEG